MRKNRFVPYWCFLSVLILLIAAGCVPQQPGAPAVTTENTPKALLPATPTTAPSPTSAPSPTPLPTLAPTSPPTAVPNQPASQPGTFPQITSLSMKDEHNGWGQSRNAVYRTQDGGKTWQDVSPQGLTADSMLSNGFFLDTNTGWVIAAGQDYTSGTIYRTSDGGKTWTGSQVPFAGGQIFFLDAQNGWVEFMSDCGAGSCAGSLYQTADGGVNWKAITTIDPSQPEAPGQLPFGGDKTGTTFLTKERGWVTGVIPMNDYSWLYITQDDGKTWQQQKLPLPPGYNSVMMAVDPPRFFSDKDGLLPVTITGESSVKVFYLTQDGGLTWTPTTPVGPNGPYDFVSLQDGFVWNGGNALHVTHDKGQTWSTVKPNIDLSQTLASFDFVNLTTGWALAMDADGKTTLYYTEDGGKTWEER